MATAPDPEELAAVVARILTPVIASTVEAQTRAARVELQSVRDELNRIHGRLDGLSEAGAFERRSSSRTDWKGISAFVLAVASSVAIMANLLTGHPSPPAPPLNSGRRSLPGPQVP